jgi:hypothetical protein
VLDWSQLEAHGRLSCGVDELLEEEDCWSEESGRFSSAGEKGVLFHFPQRGYRSFVNDGKFPGQTTRWVEGALTLLVEVLPADREFGSVFMVMYYNFQ